MQGFCAASRLHRVLGLMIALSPLLALLLVLWPATPAMASGTTITNCSNDNDLQNAVVLTGGPISFNCGGTHAPATILLSSALSPISGTVIDGSNGGKTVILDGQAGTRLVYITGDTMVTLTHLILTDGAPTNGSCVYVLGALALDNVEMHHCASPGQSGGGLYVEAGAIATLNNANVHDNSAGVSGGGIFNFGRLTVNNSTFAHNAAGTDNGPVGDGGAIWGNGFTEVNGGTFFSNTAAIGNGGGIYNQGSLLVFFASLQDNTAGIWGGGIRNWTGNTILIEDTLIGNQAGNGGGIASDGTGSHLGLEDDTTLLGNQAQLDGGGIYAAGGSLDVSGSVFKNNSAGRDGGGLFSSISAYLDTSTLAGNAAGRGGAIDNRSDVDIRDVTLSGNSAGYGAAINNAGTASLTNDTLSSNVAAYGGGVRGEPSSKATFWNVTLASNRATISGGAVYLEVGAAMTVTNTILAYSPQGGNCAGAAITSSRDSISDDFTCSLSGMVHGQPANGLDPHLSALGNYGGPTLVHMLEHNSPAIDGVSGANAPTDDQRFKPRPAGAGYDIGAVERQPTDTDWVPWLWLPVVRR